MKKIHQHFVMIGLLLISGIAHANFVWPSLYVIERLYAWWAILAGLLIEILFVRYIFQISPKQAVIACTLANIFSAVLGILLIPLSGIVWEIFPGSIYMYLFGWGTFNPITWFFAFLLACLINTFLESFIYRKYLKKEKIPKRTLWLIFLANSFSVAMAAISLLVVPLE